MIELFANSGDPDQMLHSAASDLGLHCLPVTHVGVSSINGLTCTWKEKQWGPNENKQSQKIHLWLERYHLSPSE